METAIQPAPKTGNGKSLTVKELISGDAFKSAVSAALPTHLKPERFVRIALTAMTRTPKLQQCDQGSLFACLLTLSQLGLEPDGRRAHLIPFENRKRGVTECTLIVDYKGLVELALRSGKVSFIHADVVCDQDAFEYDRGEIKQHKIDLRKPRGEVYAVYAFARFKDGTEKCEVMSRADVESIRKRSRAGQSGPWVTDWNEMAKKTVFRRLSKWVELSPEVRDAVEADDDQFEHHQVGIATNDLKTVTVDQLSQLPEIEPEDYSQDAATIEQTESQDPGSNLDDQPPQVQPPATEATHHETRRGPGRASKEKYGPESPAWAKFEELKRLAGDSDAIAAKERLGWPNTPFAKLSTAQLIQLSAALDEQLKKEAAEIERVDKEFGGN